MKHNLPTIVTFDRSLYWKAAEIITDAPQNRCLKTLFFVLMLDCLLTLMNMLGPKDPLLKESVPKHP
ncbi:hypothetical protein DPMN_014621 [Dreissena polymorpha]|uniref:Uncharacterized protein n=1 Tax=Dreissena polymorpha TaxID=45954 RepID=A0A9D4S5E3_DREPO|nr:hypothetical protein DPMN_014621 [Dreissena polymorpha]